MTNATESANWTTRLRKWIVGLVPPGQALPDRQPIYVASWIYVFGVLTIIAVMVVLFILALVVPFPSGHGEESDGGGENR